jgi:hypothetical protein
MYSGIFSNRSKVLKKSSMIFVLEFVDFRVIQEPKEKVLMSVMMKNVP